MENDKEKAEWHETLLSLDLTVCNMETLRHFIPYVKREDSEEVETDEEFESELKEFSQRLDKIMVLT